jgi:hypothetical protein
MNEIEHLNQLFAVIGKRDGLDVKLNHEGTGGLKLQSGVAIYFEYVQSNGKLYIYTSLMAVADDDPGVQFCSRLCWTAISLTSGARAVLSRFSVTPGRRFIRLACMRQL